MRIRAFRDYILAKEIKGFASVMPQNLLSLMALYIVPDRSSLFIRIQSCAQDVFIDALLKARRTESGKAGDNMAAEVRKREEEPAMCLKHSLCCLMTGS